MEGVIYALEVRSDPNGGTEAWYAVYRVSLVIDEEHVPLAVQVASFYDADLASKYVRNMNSRTPSGQRPEGNPLD